MKHGDSLRLRRQERARLLFSRSVDRATPAILSAVAYSATLKSPLQKFCLLYDVSPGGPAAPVITRPNQDGTP
jgi:hypothetical protein